MHPNDIPEAALSFQFVRSRGPGGQNVNKVSTAVQLHVDVALLGETGPVQRRLLSLAGQKATTDDRIVFFVDESRSQLQNRELAMQRLCELIVQARHVPRRRVPTRPTVSSVRKRLDTKKKEAVLKRLRRSPGGADD
jgi:ribosome-associated protein